MGDEWSRFADGGGKRYASAIYPVLTDIRRCDKSIHRRLQKSFGPDFRPKAGSILHGFWDAVVIPDFFAMNLLLSQNCGNQARVLLRRDIEAVVLGSWLDISPPLQLALHRFDHGLDPRLPTLKDRLGHVSAAMGFRKQPKERELWKYAAQSGGDEMFDVLLTGKCAPKCENGEIPPCCFVPDRGTSPFKWLTTCGCGKPATGSIVNLPPIGTTLCFMEAIASDSGSIDQLRKLYGRLSNESVHFNPHLNNPREAARFNRNHSAAAVIRDWLTAVHAFEDIVGIVRGQIETHRRHPTVGAQ